MNLIQSQFRAIGDENASVQTKKVSAEFRGSTGEGAGWQARDRKTLLRNGRRVSGNERKTEIPQQSSQYVSCRPWWLTAWRQGISPHLSARSTRSPPPSCSEHIIFANLRNCRRR